MLKNILLKKMFISGTVFKISFLLCFVSVFPLVNAGDNRLINKDFSLDGAWVPFVKIKGEVMFRPETEYIFHDNESWSIKEKGQVQKQGMIKYGSDKVYLYVESKDDRKEAIPVKVLDNNSLEITNIFENEVKLLLIKKSSLPVVSNGDICGTWEIFYKDLTTGKVRKSECILLINDKHSYQIKHPEKDISDIQWSNGSYTIANGILHFKNDFKGKHFWNDPVFFFYGKKLIYNSNSICIWAEKIDSALK